VNAGVLLFDAAGRITTLDVADFPSPYFNGGTPTGALGSLVIAENGIPAAFLDGIGYTEEGAVCVTIGGGDTEYTGGLPVEPDGLLLVSFDQAVASWVAGIPLDAAGKVCLASPVPPFDLSGFDSGFDGGFG
jgi:hypothetical protein